MNNHYRLQVIWEEFKNRKVLKVALVYMLMAWGVMQVGELLFEALQLPETSYSLLVILVLLGFPMALVLAWAYEITPEGVRRDVVLNLDPADLQKVKDETLRSQLELETGPCVAILPFRDMTPEQDKGYFCEGLAAEIQNELCQVEKLNVASRAHTIRFGNAGVDVNKVATELRVRTLLEGAVRRSNGDLRITIQLVNAISGMDIWSRSFNFRANDDFDIQREIAKSIAHSVKSTLLQQKADGRIDWDPVAYDHFIRGLRFFRRRSAKNTEYARRMFQNAIDVQPCYGRAWAGLAYTFGFEYMNFNHTQEVLRQAINTSKKAFKLNPGASESHVARGIVKSIRDKPGAASDAFDVAAAIDPENFEAWYFNAINWIRQGKIERAIHLLGRAADCDTMDYQSVLLQSQLYVSLGDETSSRRALHDGLLRTKASLLRWPNDYRALNIGALAYLQLGEHDIAHEWMKQSLEHAPRDAIIEYNAACFYSLSGDLERSLGHLENCRKYGVMDSGWLKHDSQLDAVRNLPAFEKFAEEIYSAAPTACC